VVLIVKSIQQVRPEKEDGSGYGAKLAFPKRREAARLLQWDPKTSHAANQTVLKKQANKCFTLDENFGFGWCSRYHQHCSCSCFGPRFGYGHGHCADVDIDVRGMMKTVARLRSTAQM
jgi:hypothetical protein